MRPPRPVPSLLLSLLLAAGFGVFWGAGFVLGFLLGQRPPCRPRKNVHSETPSGSPPEDASA